MRGGNGAVSGKVARYGAGLIRVIEASLWAPSAENRSLAASPELD